MMFTGKPGAWLRDGPLVYRLAQTPHGVCNCDEIHVAMVEGSRARPARELAADDILADLREGVTRRALFDLLPGTYYMDEPDGGAPTLLEQLQRMAKDAARWRAVAAAAMGIDPKLAALMAKQANGRACTTMAEANALADDLIRLARENNHADL